MTCRRRLAVAGIALCLVSGPAVAADQPPRDLHLVGDHWTAWDPPTEFPPNAGREKNACHPRRQYMRVGGRCNHIA